jgi:signal transduction histidine kinase
VDELRSAAERIGTLRRGEPRLTLPVPPTDDEIARLATTLNGMLGRLDAAAAQQRDFAADAAHELRSPLSALVTELEVALAGRDRTDWPQAASAALADSRRLARILDDLLLLARADAGQPLRREQVDLAAVIASFAQLPDDDPATLTAPGPAGGADRRAAVTVHVRSGDEPQVVVGDQAGIERAVRNLVDNARQHAASTVRVWLEPAADAVRVVVADDGEGIPADAVERVFDRFHRLDPSRARSGGGAGLGLAIVRGIARSHGGEATVQAPTGGGTVVELRLPRHPPHLPPPPGT